MDSSLIGLVGVIIVVLIAEGVNVYLRRPLGSVMRTEKGAERSDFWSAYIRIALLLVPAAFALMSFPEGSRRDPVMALVEQVRWGLAGLLITLAFAGKAIRIPTPLRIMHAPHAPSVPPPPPPTATR